MFLVKKQQNTRKKSEQNLQKRPFPAYFRHFWLEKNFLKIGLGHILGIINTHLCAENQKKLMMKSRENAKKPVFPAYFRPEKYVFRKSDSVTFQTLPFCISVQNFMKKYKVQLEKFKKYRFSAKIGCSDDFQKVPATKISFIDK